MIDKRVNSGAESSLIRGPQLLQRINQLIGKARAANAPVIAVRHIGADGSPFTADSPLTRLIEELDVDAATDKVFVKCYPNCFRDTVLSQLVKKFALKELVIVGMKSQFCVDTTRRAAADVGLKATLIADGHSTMDMASLSAQQVIAHHNETLAGPFVTLRSTEDLPSD